MWYTHPHVSHKLMLAHVLAKKIVTASVGSFRISSKKVVIIGHGIDTDMFKQGMKKANNKDMNTKIILAVGRISPIKDYVTLIKAANILINERKHRDLRFVVVGDVPMTSHLEYYKTLQRMIKEFSLSDFFKFVGRVPHDKIVEYYQQCDVYVNMSPTGSFDKSVLEAMACEKPVILCSKSFTKILHPYDKYCLFTYQDNIEMAEKIEKMVYDEKLRREVGEYLREQVFQCCSLKIFVDNLVKIFEEALRNDCI